MITHLDNPLVRVADSLLHRGDDGGVPIDRNNVGFSAFDYPRAAAILSEVDATGRVTRDQGFALLRLLRRYHRQLGELGFNLETLERAAHAIPDDEDDEDDDEIAVPVNSLASVEDETDDVPRLDMAAILGPNGVIAERMPGYESRPTQVQLAQAIADGMVHGENVLAEAGTGTGKSLAYLIPAIYSGKKTIVSTEGKALQDQLCVAPETKILTADLRYIPAKDITEGMHLLAFEEERVGNRRHFCDSVVESVQDIERPCYEIELEDGTTVTCSDEHRWLVGHRMEIKWMTTEQLCSTAGKRLGSKIIRIADVWEIDTSYEAGYLAAAFDGEGHLSQKKVTNLAGGHSNHLAFAQSPNAMLDRVRGYLTALGFDYRAQLHTRSDEGHKDMFALYFGNRKDMLRFLGQVRPARLLEKFNPDLVGTIPAVSGDSANGNRVIRKTFVGTKTVRAIRTSSRTYIAEGLASHNCSKDLPFLKNVLPVQFQFAVLKGLSNYLCLFKLDEERGAQLALGQSWEFSQIDKWAEETLVGDLAELTFTITPELRSNVTSTTDECLGKECPLYDACFAMKARAAAKDADVIVVNHTLLSLDLALRDKTSDGVAVLPDRDLIVVDEAHSLEDVATKAFTIEATNWTVPSLLRGKLPIKAGFTDEQMATAREASEEFFAQFAPDQRQTFSVTATERLTSRAEKVRLALLALAGQAKRAATDEPLTGISFDPNLKDLEPTRNAKQLENYASRIRGWADVFGQVLQGDADTHVTFVEKSVGRKGNTTTALRCAPISVAEDLDRALWTRWPTVATSATLSTHGNFSYFRGRTGCENGREIIVDSPFDFGRNALLYLPANGSAFDPSKFREDGSIEYFDRLANEIEALLLASDGRAFCLFTSRKALDEVYNRLDSRLRWTVLRQGEFGTQETIRRFREDGHAVLFGLRTFWAGVDVQGEALSLVIIDKLPFPTPDEPVYQARCDLLNRQKNDKWAWFSGLALPLCAIQFKQGFGRLIRTKSDRGVVALLDGRLTTKGYGTGIIRSLPPAKQTRSLDVVRAFFGAG
jgi:ATP-dependent DNA helicase DinG